MLLFFYQLHHILSNSNQSMYTTIMKQLVYCINISDLNKDRNFSAGYSTKVGDHSQKRSDVTHEKCNNYCLMEK